MRRARLAILMAALAAMSAPLVVQAKDNPTGISTAEEAQLQRALNRGQLIYAYDQAAWHGTDDLVAKLPDYASKVGGWVVDGPAEAAHLVFFSRGEANPRAVYVADFRDNKLVSSKVLGPGDDAKLTLTQLEMIDARQRVLAKLPGSGITPCSRSHYNTVVLPPETPGGPDLVYVLTPQTSANSIPMGGHYLFEVGADHVVGPPRAFTKSCIDLATTGGSGKPAALVISHLLDPVPTEIHVFSMFAARLPMFVITTQNDRMWSLNIKSGHAQVSWKPLKK